jgi:hypothetical protein
MKSTCTDRHTHTHTRAQGTHPTHIGEKRIYIYRTRHVPLCVCVCVCVCVSGVVCGGNVSYNWLYN